ncbi:MAG: NfeD family protein [Myxococcales bacterium]|nr:NfeD family protein [Myxococcales bacterium]
MTREPHGRAWVVGKYVLLQIPGWVVVGGLLVAGVRWWGLSQRLALVLFGAWLLKDVVLFPLLRVAYEPEGGSGGADGMVGARGVAREDLDPAGYVRLGAELWRAELAEGAGPVRRGDTVRVRAVRGLTLVVGPEPGEAP